MTNSRVLPLVSALLVLSLVVLGTACGKKTATAPAGSSTVTLTLTNVPHLANGLNYEAWAVEYYNGYYYGHPMAIFNFRSDGQMVSAAGDTLLNGQFTTDLAPADVYGVGISIENSSVLVTTASVLKLLGATITNGAGTLTTDSWMGMSVDLSAASGRYILATPTDSVNNNEKSGIWFLDLSTGISLNGLSLPDMVSVGWAYEGWVVKDGVYLSTGKFTSANGADGTNVYGGTYASPQFPGQDFLQSPPAGLTFPTDLSGSTVMVTLEPASTYDTDPGNPFYFKLLEGTIPSNAVDHTTYYMTKASGGVPGGTVTVK